MKKLLALLLGCSLAACALSAEEQEISGGEELLPVAAEIIAPVSNDSVEAHDAPSLELSDADLRQMISDMGLDFEEAILESFTRTQLIAIINAFETFLDNEFEYEDVECEEDFVCDTTSCDVPSDASELLEVASIDEVENATEVSDEETILE